MDTAIHLEVIARQPRTQISRRIWLRRAATGTVALASSFVLPAQPASPEPELYRIQRNRIRQSVIHWCYKPMPVEELASAAARLGLGSVELVTPDCWPALKKLGLICAMAPSHGFTLGFAHREEHEHCLQVLRERIEQCAAADFPSVITFSGFRRGLSDAKATRNMVEGLKQIAGFAEKKKVNVCLEVLNSRVHIEMKGHPDYFCDHIEPAIEILRQVGSERVKLLYDIYHVQIMEGDLISRLRQFQPYIAHYHTGGNPGRNEIDDTQEIGYPAIMRAIVETGYTGWVGQEFIPTRQPITSLSEAAKLCDV